MASSELDRSSGVPLYRQIAEILRTDISAGRVDAREPMTEAKLIARFDVSLAPIRQALTELTRDGVVYRKQGRGTFPVSGVRVDRPADLKAGDLYRYLSDSGLHPTSRVTGIGRVAPPEMLVSRWGTPPGERALHFTRLIFVDEQPFAENDIYVRSPEAFLPTADELADGGSALAFLERRYGVHIHHAEHEAWASTATEQTGPPIGLAEGKPVFVIDTTFYQANGDVVGWRRAIHRPEEFTFRFVTNS